MKKILVIVNELDSSIMERIEAVKVKEKEPCEIILTNLNEKRDLSEFNLVIIDSKIQEPVKCEFSEMGSLIEICCTGSEYQISIQKPQINPPG